jgi:hypothetical protein
MRIWCIVLVVIAIAVAQRPATAQDNAKALKAAAMQAEAMKRIMAKFDLNGDGSVDDEEKAKVTEQFAKDIEGGNIPDGFKELLDRNRNGKLEPQEAAAFREIMARLQASGGGQPQFGAGGRGGDGGGAFGGKGGDGGGPFGGRGGDGGGAFGGPVPPDILKKFDKNKDGELDDKERKAAVAAMGPKKSRKEQLQAKLDLNGDGKITKEEREEVAAQRKAEQEEKKAEAEEKKAKSKRKTDDKEKDDKDDEKADKEEKPEKEDKAEKDAKDEK